jgi:hypothetical protein
MLQSAQTTTLPMPPLVIPSEHLTGPGAKLIRITTELKDIVRHETDLLESKRPQEIKSLQGQKIRLMSQYKDAMNNARVNESLLGPEDSDIRMRIKEVTVSLREELKRNARIVIRLKTITEGLLKSVGEEVSKRDRPAIGYGKGAKLIAPKTVRPTSLSFNRMI